MMYRGKASIIISKGISILEESQTVPALDN